MIGKVKSAIVSGRLIVQSGDPQRACDELEPIISEIDKDDKDIPAKLRALAHGVVACAKKRTGQFERAFEHAKEAIKLDNNDYRYVYNLACYRWLSKKSTISTIEDRENIIEAVVRDLRSIKKHLKREVVENEIDFEGLRKEKQFKEFLNEL